LNRPHLLFSYGTLRQEEVQRANFGRLLGGRADALSGYRIDQVSIDDAEVVAESGSAIHPILVPDADAGPVRGMVFALSDAELAAADEYETSAYERVEVVLVSGTRAFVYAAARVQPK
jgi:gamma-glutamylcyclotransferase (GGCT)/AIG2-like uncharacterized protein YtfP